MYSNPSLWTPIPGYENYYWIDKEGSVKNRDGHILKPIESSKGLMIELRCLGQREKVLVSDLLKLIGGVLDETDGNA